MDWAIRYKLGSSIINKVMMEDIIKSQRRGAGGSGKGKKSPELLPNDRVLTLKLWSRGFDTPQISQK